MNHYKITEIKEGISVSFEADITKEKMEMFRSITADENPMHCSDEYAKSEGYDGRICYGMLTASFYSTLAGVYMPGEQSLLQSVETKFLKPVYIGDHLTVTGTVKLVNYDLGVIKVDGIITNQDGKRVSKAQLQILVRSSYEN